MQSFKNIASICTAVKNSKLNGSVQEIKAHQTILLNRSLIHRKEENKLPKKKSPKKNGIL